MSWKPCTVADLPKGSTLCAGWFFGGPHQWDIEGTPRCTVKRRQKPPYSHKWSAYHEWQEGRCIHCKKTRAELKPKRTERDRCSMCGLTRYDVKLLARLALQPRLEAQNYGHAAPQPKRSPGLRLAVDNTKRSA